MRKDDAKYIEAALSQILNVEIKLNPTRSQTVAQIAEEIATRLEGICLSSEPTSGSWALLALGAEPGTFENAIFVHDHCFDGIGLDDYASLICEIIGLAGNEWNVQGVDVKNAPDRDSATEWEQPVIVEIRTEPEVAPFELINAKDFDWSIIFRLNERLPKTATGQFAIFLDGNATIVFLSPTNIQRLNALCGYEFFYLDEQENQGMQTSH